MKEPDLPAAYPVDGALLPPPHGSLDQYAVPTVLVPSSSDKLADDIGASIAKETWPNSVLTSVVTIVLYVIVKLFGRKLGA